MQNELFPDDRYRPPLSRNSDPATSSAAAKTIAPKLGTLKQRAMFVWSRQAGTAEEIAAECVRQFGGRADSYRKRKAELVRDGLIRRVSVRRCMITGHESEVFEGRPYTDTGVRETKAMGGMKDE